MIKPALNGVQNDSMWGKGKAMARAPIISGMQKFPKQPARIGMMTKKIMIVACMVTAMLYCAGSRIPPVSLRMPPSPGMAVSGQASCQRTTRARRRSEEHTSELQSQSNLVCRLLLEKKKNKKKTRLITTTRQDEYNLDT